MDIDKSVLEEVAREKLEFHRKEVAKWELFLNSLGKEEVVVVGRTELSVAPTINPALPEKKIEYASLIREFFTTVKKKAKARDVAAWVIKKAKVERSQHNIIKPKIYSQLATFDKQKKVRQKKVDTTVWCEWIADTSND